MSLLIQMECVLAEAECLKGEWGNHLHASIKSDLKVHNLRSASRQPLTKYPLLRPKNSDNPPDSAL
ncbi:hypothetical protein, partial [Endozoicomonas sp. ONNA1]|uniref:hypothetical protein n=1 Tax=Endozoicomonas sp. ONNA1 TaxID=2828740 RepID=UPI0021485520